MEMDLFYGVLCEAGGKSIKINFGGFLCPAGYFDLFQAPLHAKLFQGLWCFVGNDDDCWEPFDPLVVTPTPQLPTFFVVDFLAPSAQQLFSFVKSYGGQFQVSSCLSFFNSSTDSRRTCLSKTRSNKKIKKIGRSILFCVWFVY